MTIYELIDRLKTADDKNADVFIIEQNAGDGIAARFVTDVMEIEGNVFIEAAKREYCYVSTDEVAYLKPNRKDEE